MKKIIVLLLAVIMGLAVTACGETEKNIIETKYCILTVPDYWIGNYCFDVSDGELSEANEFTLSVYEKGNYERFEGGNLFDIIITADEHFDAFAVGEKIKEINIDSNQYYIFARYPSDVQFDSKGQKLYVQMEKDVKTVINSIEAK